MRMFSRIALSFLATLLLLSGSVVADTIYTYTGDAFVAAWVLGPLSVGVYTPADRITGSFTVGDGFIPGRLAIGAAFTYGPFGPDRAVVDGVLDYAFTDGHQTLTKRNSTATIVLEIPADPAAWANGFQPGSWLVSITTPTTASITTELLFGDRSDRGVLDAENAGSNVGCFFGGCDGSHGGTWAAQTVPEPATLTLVGAGLVALGAGVWRQRRST